MEQWRICAEKRFLRTLVSSYSKQACACVVRTETTIAATALAFVPNNEIYLLSIVRGQTFEVKETWNPNHVEIETNIRMLTRLKQHSMKSMYKL